MRVFKTKWFARFARHERIPDRSLCEAVQRAQRGLVDADLGGGVIKQRVARQGGGRSGGYRVLIAYRREAKAVFLYGFAKSERGNVNPRDLADWQSRAQDVLAAGNDLIESNVADDILREVYCDQKEKN